MGKKRRKAEPVTPPVESEVVQPEPTAAAATPGPEAPTSGVTADVDARTDAESSRVQQAIPDVDADSYADSSADSDAGEPTTPDAAEPEAAEPELVDGGVVDPESEPDESAADIMADTAEPELTVLEARGPAETVPSGEATAEGTREDTEPAEVESTALESAAGETLVAGTVPTDGAGSEPAPKLVRPELVEPRFREPLVVEPEFAQPGDVGPEGAERELVVSQTSEPEDVDSESSEPRGVERESREPEGVVSEDAEPELVSSESSEPQAAVPVSSEPQVAEPEDVEPEVVDSESSEPRGVERETGGPETGESARAEAGGLDTAVPDAVALSTTTAEDTEPDTTEPDTTEPDTTEPDTTEPDTTEPSESQPDVHEVGLETSPAASVADDEADAATSAAGVSKDDDRDSEAQQDALATAPSDVGDSTGGPVEGKAAWRRLLLMGRPRSTKANLLGALLAVALGIGIGTQVQLTNQRGLSELSQTDLVRVLDDISARSSRLDDQIRELETTRDRLKNGTGTTAEALEQAQKRADTLGILAGTIGAQGPGITLRISDPEEQVTGPLVLDLIQELRDAGAEAIDVGGVRVVASSFVGQSDGTIQIDGTPIDRPFVVKAIGESKTLSSALTIPGGIIETIRQKRARATVTESENLEVTSLHAAEDPTNAKPSE